MPTETRKSPLVGNSQKLALPHNHVVKPFHPATPVNKRGECTPVHQKLPLSGGVTEWIPSDNINIHCKYCKSANVVKNGPHKNKPGQLDQKYHCRTCNRYFVLENRRFVKNRYERFGVVLKEYTDGKSLRGTSRSANVSHVTALN